MIIPQYTQMSNESLCYTSGTNIMLCVNYISIKKEIIGSSLVVQWLRHCASTAEGAGSIPAMRIKIPHVWPKKKKLVERKKEKRISLEDARESMNSKANLNGKRIQQGIWYIIDIWNTIAFTDTNNDQLKDITVKEDRFITTKVIKYLGINLTKMCKT